MNRAIEDLQQSFLESARVMEGIANTQADEILAIGDLIAEVVLGSGCVFLFGNGGSAADCQHIAAEFVGRFVLERNGLPAVALTTDTSALTAIANDYGYECVFERQVNALVREGDIAIGLSTSGRSENVIRGLKAARKRGASTVALTGEDSRGCGECADRVVRVPSKVTARIQEGHIAVGHRLCERVDQIWEERSAESSGA